MTDSDHHLEAPPADQVAVRRDERGQFLTSGNPETQFRPGQSGNPAGRPAAGASVVEWMNLMAEWPEAQLREVADDPAAPVNRRAAAQRWLAAISDDPEKESREATAFVCDRTSGKPRATTLLQHAFVPGGLSRDTLQAFAADPQARALARQIGARLRELQDAEELPEIVADHVPDDDE
jgi:hypothetical protein